MASVTTARTPPCAEGVIRSAAPADDCASRSKPWVLAASIIESSMAIIDGVAVSIVTPVIGKDLVAGLGEMQWVVNAYVLVTASLTLVGGSLGDRLGRRRVFATGIAVFALGSIACGLAPDAVTLILARIAQGVGGALMIPNSLAIIGATFAEGERGRAVGTWAGVTAIAGALAPVFGGWLADAVSWRAIFFINVPLALAGLIIAWIHVPESRVVRAPSGAEAAPGFDWLGAALVAGGLGSITLALIRFPDHGWRDPSVLISLVAGAALLIAFLRVEAQSRAPMMPPALFRIRAFAGVNLMTLLLYAALAAMMFVFPFNLIRIQGYSAASAGAAFLPFPIMMTFLSRWSGGLIDRFGARTPLIAGPLIVAAAMALLVRPGVSTSYWIDFFPPMVLLGLGMAISVAPLTTTVISSVPNDQTGVASAINNAISDVATLFAVAVFGAASAAVFAHGLDLRLDRADLSADAARAVAVMKQTFAGTALPEIIRGEDRTLLQRAGAEALLGSFRVTMLGAAVLAVLASLCAAATIGRLRVQGRPQQA